jgi:Holliday junction resolvase-like predicted endonuclease
MSKNIYIIKADGSKEPFSETKLRHSLERIKAAPAIIDHIVAQIKNELQDGMKTSEIYRRAFSLLRQHKTFAAGRYSLKKAIMDLGPSGHPFEKLVGELLKSEGYAVDVSVIVQGRCVPHEVDVIAKKDTRCIMVECKFHNQSGIKSDVKVALYIQARFEDLVKHWQMHSDTAQKFDEAWLMTNTKLTSEAIQYANCVGMKAIGWNYPPRNGLEKWVERTGLHPVTSLTTLTKYQKSQLINKGIVTCREVKENMKLLQFLNYSEIKISKIIKEINELCKSK